jgi:hypothetical protein
LSTAPGIGPLTFRHNGGMTEGRHSGLERGVGKVGTAMGCRNGTVEKANIPLPLCLELI